jgi:hypothetical protein
MAEGAVMLLTETSATVLVADAVAILFLAAVIAVPAAAVWLYRKVRVRRGDRAQGAEIARRVSERDEEEAREREYLAFLAEQFASEEKPS